MWNYIAEKWKIDENHPVKGGTPDNTEQEKGGTKPGIPSSTNNTMLKLKTAFSSANHEEQNTGRKQPDKAKKK